MPNDTHFQPEWLDSPEFGPWVRKGSTTKEVKCSACCCSLSIANGGKVDLKNHAKTAKHLRAMERFRGQQTFAVSSTTGSVGLSKPIAQHFSHADQVSRSEIFALHCHEIF